MNERPRARRDLPRDLGLLWIFFGNSSKFIDCFPASFRNLFHSRHNSVNISTKCHRFCEILGLTFQIREKRHPENAPAAGKAFLPFARLFGFHESIAEEVTNVFGFKTHCPVVKTPHSAKKIPSAASEVRRRIRRQSRRRRRRRRNLGKTFELFPGVPSSSPRCSS